MKTFYTVRDIEDMHATGVVEIQIHDDVVLTDVAREKAIALGMHLVTTDSGSDRRPTPGSPRLPATARPDVAATVQSVMNPPSQTDSGVVPADQVMKIKAAVITRLGTDKYNDLLDQLIPQVISQLKKQPRTR